MTFDHNNATTLDLQTSPDAAVERVQMTQDLADKLHLTIRNRLRYIPTDLHHQVEVHHVIPCVTCGMPVAAIEFSDRGTRRFDAVPDAFHDCWTVDLITPHNCRVNSFWDTETLSRAVACTRRHGSVFIDVRFACRCRCGQLVAPVRLDGGSIQLYEAIDQSSSAVPAMWRTPEYVADLTHPHRCSAKGEVCQ